MSNTSAVRGGGLHVYWAYTAKTCLVFNTICYFNTGTTGSNWNHNIDSGGGVIYSNNCFAPSVSAYGEGNIDTDPTLRDIGGDYRPSRDSPCRDTGLPLSWMSTAVDLAGQPRVSGTNVDIGAYEYILPPSGTILSVR